MLTGPPARVLELVGAHAADGVVLKDIPRQNASWLIGTGLVLWRYHDGATAADLAYEHAVPRHLADAGWAVPAPVGGLIEDAGLWYCLTRRVPGRPVPRPSAALSLSSRAGVSPGCVLPRFA
jgi:hypothetical protein